MHITVFLRRDTICVNVVFPVTRCPSICLSVTFVYCIQTAEDIVNDVKLLSLPGFDLMADLPKESADQPSAG